MKKGTKADDMNFINKLFMFFLIFFFILAPRFNFNIIIHMGLVSVSLLTMLVIVKRCRIFFLFNPLFFIIIFFLFLALYHLLLSNLYDNDASYFLSICISVIISVLFGWLLASYLINQGVQTSDLLDQLLMICTIVAILNSSIILVNFKFPEIKSIIESYLLQNTEGLVYAEHPFQLRGLASAGGAGISVFNSIAVLFLIYLVSNNKITTSFALLSAVVITCSNVFTGRTGLILSLLFTSTLLIIILIKNLKSGFIRVISAISVAIFSFFLLDYSTIFDLDPEVAGWAFEWVDGLITGKLESASSDDLQTMLFLPDDLIHLLFGVGFFEGVGTIYPRTDSGYIKSILSIGVPLSFLLYFAIIFMFFRVRKVSSKYSWLVVSVLSVMLIVEVKEPFLYQNFTARMILLLSGAAMFILAKRRALAKIIMININRVD
jgi:hypothetical protein